MGKAGVNSFRIPLIFIILFIPTRIFALDYGLDAKCENPGKINDLQIFSERCCGSNYAGFLICRNLFPHIQNYTSEYNPYGHKHFPPWFYQPIEEYTGPKEYYNFNGSENVLFVVVFRDPYDWIRSFYQKPWYAVDYLRSCSFSEFIRSTWMVNFSEYDMIRELGYNQFLDCYTNGMNFPNPIVLRNEKNKNFLRLKERVNNIYFINYETILYYPEEVIAEISEMFSIPKTSIFQYIKDYKGDIRQGKYRKKNYSAISQTDLDFINNQLDPDIEEILGYSLKYSAIEFILE